MLTLLTEALSSKPLDSGVYRQVQADIYADVSRFFGPEAIVLFLVLLMVGFGIFRRFDAKPKLIHFCVFIGLVAATYLCSTQDWSQVSAVFLDFGYLPEIVERATSHVQVASGSMLAADGLSHFFRLFLLFTALLTVWMAMSAKEMADRSTTEFYILMLGSLGGMLLLASSNHMLMVYLAVEMMSLPSYCLVALRRKQRRATEASLKYMLFGSVASGLMIYGLSLIYGMTGGLSFDVVAKGVGAISEDSQQVAALGIGILLFIVGIGYKMAIAPMHFWCPDAYEGAPTPVTAFLSVASKAAGFAVAIRFIYLMTAAGSGAGLQNFPWVEMLAAIGILTMTIGNLSAIRQENMKRMLAYSSIAHAGYLMIGLTAMAAGLLTGSETLAAAGITAMVIYFLAYLFTNYGAFAALIAIENEDNDNENVSGFRALAKRNLALAIFVFFILLSLLGVPPTFGFFGKMALFVAGVAHAKAYPVIIVMLIAAALNTAVSAVYYYRIAKEMILVDAERGTYSPFAMPWITKALVGTMSIALLALFVGFGGVTDADSVDGSASVLMGVPAADDLQLVFEGDAKGEQTDEHAGESAEEHAEHASTGEGNPVASTQGSGE